MLDTAAARTARTAISEACASGLDGPALLHRVGDALVAAVPFDGAGWSTCDPGTLLPVGGWGVGLADDVCRAYFDNEVLTPDVNKLRHLVRRARPSGLLSEATGGDLARSPRYRTMMRPYGHEHELRAAFIADGACWGSVCLVREGSRPEFTAAELEYVTAIGRLVAQGLRTATATRAAARPTPGGPGLLIVDEELRVVSVTPEAQGWLEEVESGWERYDAEVPACVRSVIARARAVAAGGAALPPRIRVRIRPDRWVVVHASRLDVGGAWAVVLEAARPAEVLPLVAQAHELTPREHDVFGLLLRGASDKEIAATLVISDHTAREHARRVLQKFGVRSRTDLVVQVFADHYAPDTAATPQAPESPRG